MNQHSLKYFLPQAGVDLIRYFTRTWSNQLPIRASSARNRIWQQKFHGEKVLVIGNGPSMSRVDIKMLAGTKAIVMNSFNRSPWRDNINIVAHCIGEPAMVSAWSKQEIDQNILGTDAASYWLHPTSYGKFDDNPKSSRIHYSLNFLEPGLASNRLIDLGRPSLAYQTTAQLAIQVALYMGFNRIGLLGFDHDWLANPDFSRHFYSDGKDSHDMLHTLTYLEIVQMIDRMWRIYYKMRDIADQNDVSVQNLTTGSYLDVFARAELQEFLAH